MCANLCCSGVFVSHVLVYMVVDSANIKGPQLKPIGEK